MDFKGGGGGFLRNLAHDMSFRQESLPILVRIEPPPLSLNHHCEWHGTRVLGSAEIIKPNF